MTDWRAIFNSGNWLLDRFLVGIRQEDTAIRSRACMYEEELLIYWHHHHHSMVSMRRLSTENETVKHSSAHCSTSYTAIRGRDTALIQGVTSYFLYAAENTCCELNLFLVRRRRQAVHHTNLLTYLLIQSTVYYRYERSRWTRARVIRTIQQRVMLLASCRVYCLVLRA